MLNWVIYPDSCTSRIHLDDGRRVVVYSNGDWYIFSTYPQDAVEFGTVPTNRVEDGQRAVEEHLYLNGYMHAIPDLTFWHLLVYLDHDDQQP